MTDTPASRPVVAYLLKRFPRLSETFILHEILELERQGVKIRIYSILNPGETVVQADVARVRAAVHYLPDGWFRLGVALAAHGALLSRDPRRYLAALVTLARTWHSIQGLKDFLRAGWLARELQIGGITHLHAHFVHQPADIAYFVHLLTGLPYSVTAHAKDIYTSPPALLEVKMRAACFVVTCTEYNRRYLRGLTGTERIHGIYHGLDLHKFDPHGDQHHGTAPAVTPIILAVGRLVEKKGFSYLIRAMRILIDARYDVHLQIAGGGDLQDTLQDQIVCAGLQNHVTLLGWHSQDALIALYRRATVFALPSIVMENGDRDGIPNVLVEAMRMRLPVVATAISGIPELVIDGETGLLVAPRDAEALAAALARLLDDSALRNRLTSGAAQHVVTEFDLRTNTARLRSLLEEGIR